MVSPSSDLAMLDKQKQNKNSDQWNGEENALSALQAKAEARLKKDSLANEDEEKHASTVKPGDIVEVDDSGEEVPSDSESEGRKCLILSLRALPRQNQTLSLRALPRQNRVLVYLCSKLCML